MPRVGYRCPWVVWTDEQSYEGSESEGRRAGMRLDPLVHKGFRTDMCLMWTHASSLTQSQSSACLEIGGMTSINTSLRGATNLARAVPRL